LATDVNSLEAGLEEAAREEVVSEESSTEESAEAAEQSAEDKAKPKKGAQDRIRELVTARKALESKLEELEQASKKKDGELGELIKLIQARESDTRTIQAIKDLHATDPVWREHIEKLDKRIKGEEVELESQSKKADEADDYSKVKDLLKQNTDKLESAQNELRDQMILDKVDRVVDRYFESLPSEYNAADRKVLQKVLADHIDWDSINANPDVLTQKVASGIQSALDWYGQPRGAAPTANAETPAAKTEQPDPKARLESLMKKDYGKGKLVETNGQKRFEPLVSEDQWVKELGEALRLSRQTP
jgi:myosin heavy subunit